MNRSLGLQQSIDYLIPSAAAKRPHFTSGQIVSVVKQALRRIDEAAIRKDNNRFELSYDESSLDAALLQAIAAEEARRAALVAASWTFGHDDNPVIPPIYVDDGQVVATMAEPGLTAALNELREMAKQLDAANKLAAVRKSSSPAVSTDVAVRRILTRRG